MPFHGVFNYNDPSEALAFWYDAFFTCRQQACTTKTEKGETSETAAMVN